MADAKGTTITWLGHATVLIKTAQGTSILIDPFVEGNARFPKGYALPERLDLILATHGHMDHIGDLVPVAKRTGATVVAMYELATWAGRKGIEKTVPMNTGGSVILGDVKLSLTEARHSSSIKEGDATLYGGEPAGFVLSIQDGPVLYHAGDTSLFSDMRLIHELWRPTFGMLPIGDHFTMGPEAAAKAASLLELEEVLPIHWGTFPALTGTPEALEKHLGPDARTRVLYVEPGQEITPRMRAA